jgi:signal transduction histidine kinase
VTLRVSSSGEVVPTEAVSALFEPFHRGGVARTSHDGAGLGLSIVRAVVAAHAGTVHAEPVAGGGLAVTVQLPAA